MLMGNLNPKLIRFVGKINADLKLSLPFKSERAELKKMELPGDEISLYGYEG